jgi:hypothetical protein
VPTLANFLHALFTTGEVAFHAPPLPQPEEQAAALDRLRKEHARAALELAGPAPEFRPQAALAAAEFVRQACWFLVHRGEPDDEPRRRLALGNPAAPADHFAADLTLRYLPHLHRRARALAPDDVLTTLTTEALRRWPLSGVLADVAEAPLTPPDFADHIGLELLYAERLAEHEKAEWLPAGRGRERVELALCERGRTSSPLLTRSADDDA